VPYPGGDEHRVLAIAASVESQSEHPLARAIVSEANKRDIPFEKIEEFLSVTGAGLRAKANGKSVLIGSRAFLEDNDITGLKELVDQADRLGAEARTVVWIASDGAAVGIIGISDPIKETTPSSKW
jgi:Cu+-exporting ATPase